MFKEAIKRSPVLYRHALAWREARRRRAPWTERGRLPDHDKRQLLRTTAAEHGLHVFVETGTYEGGTCFSLRKAFDDLYTIELQPELHRLAVSRLAPYRNIHLFLGDGATVLPVVLSRLDRPALFWLDSHGCTPKSAAGGSPALVELELVLSHPLPHVALIDDVRLLGTPGWPTLADLGDCAERHGRTMTVADDVARVLP